MSNIGFEDFQFYHVKARLWRVICTILAAVLCLGCHTISNHLVARQDGRVPRAPETGVMLGAEARDLGLVDAPGAVLFVHGLVMTGNSFADVPEKVAAHGWRVRVMRLPGHGTSPRDLENVTTEELLQAVESELAALKKDYPKVVLVGHSMGGSLGTLVAANDDVAGLVLAAPYYAVTNRWYYLRRPEKWVRFLAQFMRWGYKSNTFMQIKRREARDQIQGYRWAPTRSLVTLTQLGEQAANPDVLRRVTCPVLLIHARGDVSASPRAAQKAFEQMGSAQKKTVWLENSNHHIFWDYDREFVADEILAFVEAVIDHESHQSHE
ncbi:MAG: alpha/beta fold hydrolase [Candidatus Hydrogenedentes bacterium]|nr:alpha/beta fold hydrolase [Candidatus Hydrogenedentota bacterium]